MLLVDRESFWNIHGTLYIYWPHFANAKTRLYWLGTLNESIKIYEYMPSKYTDDEMK